MNKVVTINLNGTAFQLEEQAYDRLRAYMDKSEKALRNNPDRSEILSDIEQSIADKCRNYLSPSKNVLLASEIEEILSHMGSVEDETEGPAEADAGASAAGKETAGEKASASEAEPSAPFYRKRLYKLPEGAMVGGVCNGLAAYIGVDVAFIRLGFAALAFLYGTSILAYFVLMIILDDADTPEKKAALFGDKETTANDFVRRAKEGYYDQDDKWKRRAERRQARREFKRRMRTWAWDLEDSIYAKIYGRMPNAGHADAGTPTAKVKTHSAWRVILPLFQVIKGLFTLLFVACLLVWIFHNVNAHTCSDQAFWQVIVLLSLAFAFLSWPLKALRNLCIDLIYDGGRDLPWYPPLWNAIFSILLFGLILFLVAHFLPGVGHHLHHFYEVLKESFADLSSLKPEA